MEKTTFDLDKKEAALIFHQDLSVELVLPKMDDSEEVHFDENQNIFVAMAIASLTDHPAMRQLVGAKLGQMMGMAEEGCGGGCGGCKTPPEVGDESGCGHDHTGCCETKDEKCCEEDPGDGS